MNSFIRRACELSNMGSMMLSSGQTSKSLDAYQRALLSVKKAALAFEASGSFPVATTESTRRIDAVHPFPECEGYVSQIAEGENFLFDRPFLLELADDDIIDDATISLYSAAILFNFALAYHHQGQESHLIKATRLYEMCLQLIWQQESLDGVLGASTLAVVALNNKAHCHYELCDYEQSQDLMGEMTSILEASGMQLEEMLNPQVLADLGLNSLMLLNQPPTAAKAA